MKIKIRNRFSGEIILLGEYKSIKECLEKNSGADLRRANLRGADLIGADLNGANLSEANLSEANLYGANLRGADLSEANLIEANLRGADLREANLIGANLVEANLIGANLYEANLYGAKNMQLPIINLTGSRHYFFYLNGEIQIGCEKHTVAHWIENYKTIGEANEYTEDQIKEYFGYINMVNNLIETGKV